MGLVEQCAEFQLEWSDYIDSEKLDAVGLILAVTEASERRNNEEKDGKEHLSLFLLDEVANIIKDELGDYTRLGQLKDRQRVLTVTCLNPSEAGAAGKGAYSLLLPDDSDSDRRTGSLYSRVLTVQYRNTARIREFNRFYLQHGGLSLIHI